MNREEKSKTAEMKKAINTDWEDNDMKVTLITKLFSMLLFILCSMLISINWTQKTGIAITFVKSAYARVGRPATPASVAGVHRRAHRRSHYYYNNNYYNNGY